MKIKAVFALLGANYLAEGIRHNTFEELKVKTKLLKEVKELHLPAGQPPYIAKELQELKAESPTVS